MDIIQNFKTSHQFLSNFYPVEVEFEGIMWPSSEHAYQAAKTIIPEEKQKIFGMTVSQAKREGSSLTLRSDWDKIKFMTLILESKFTNPVMRDLLLETGTAKLVEGNWWHDEFWGVDIHTGKGLNWLGVILMRIRRDLQLY